MLDSSGAPTVKAILPLGDNQYYCGGPGSWSLSYAASWGRMQLKAITYPIPGNHEHLTDGGSSPSEATGCDTSNAGGAGYYGYWGTNYGSSGNPSRGYYSYDVGTWHIIALNSSCSAAGGCSSSTPQGKWLRNDLAAHSNMCTLAYWHIPLFSSGGRAASAYKSFWDALYTAGADVVLNGHDHTYERFAPQTPGGVADVQRGLRQWVVGTGGANHTSWGTIAANSESRNNTVYGVLKLTLHPTSYDWRFEPESRDASRFSDQGTGACHGTSPDMAAPSAPSGLTATAVGSTRVDLAWTKSTDNIAVTSYSVYRDGGATPIGSASGTSYSDTTVAAGSTHGYTVRAVDGVGNTSGASNTATATTPYANKVLQFIPVADAWIDNGAPSANHGTAAGLEVDSSPAVRDTLMRFTVSGIGSSTVLGAQLRLAVTNSSTGSVTTQAYPPVAGAPSWAEGTVTWANAPAADMARRLGALGPVASGSSYSLDLGSDYIDGDGSYTLRLVSGSTDGTMIASREAAAASRPVLIVTATG
jgi:hypothetical protein